MSYDVEQTTIAYLERRHAALEKEIENALQHRSNDHPAIADLIYLKLVVAEVNTIVVWRNLSAGRMSKRDRSGFPYSYGSRTNVAPSAGSVNIVPNWYDMEDRAAASYLIARQVFQHRVASGFGLVESFKWRAGDPDRATASVNRTPRRHITGASVKAGTGWAFIADHERIALAGCAPYFHVLDGTVELQGHCQWGWGHSIDQQAKRFIGDARRSWRAGRIRKTSRARRDRRRRELAIAALMFSRVKTGWLTYHHHHRQRFWNYRMNNL